MTDNEILATFFDQARRPLNDDGFTQRVMANLPRRSEARRLRTIRRWLNVGGCIAIVAMLATFMATTPMPTVAPTAIPDTDTMLVKAILLLRQLPHIMPSPLQYAALLATLVIVTIQSLRPSYTP